MKLRETNVKNNFLKIEKNLKSMTLPKDFSIFFLGFEKT